MSFSVCEVNGSNTGGVRCDISRGVLSMPLIFNDELAAGTWEDAQTFFDSLIAGSKKSKTAAGKVYPTATVEELADKSEANKEGTLGLGFKSVLFEGRPAYEAKVFADAIQLKGLRKWNNKTVGIMEYDSNDNIWHTVSNGKARGFDAKIFVVGNKMGTGQNVEEGVTTITISFLNVKQYFDNAYAQPILDNNIEDIVGLVDVQGWEPVAHTSNVYKIGWRLKLTQSGAYLNMQEKFPSTLFVGSNFVAKTGANFATSLTITSVAADATNKCGTFTFDSTAYAALAPGAEIKVSAIAPELLDAADVTGIEIESIIVKK